MELSFLQQLGILPPTQSGGPPVNREQLWQYVAQKLDESEREQVILNVSTYADWYGALQEVIRESPGPARD